MALLAAEVVVAEEAARLDWVRRVVRSLSLSRTDILVFLLRVERKTCLSRRTLSL